jgi:ABC-type branched-subunit amino acid transport system ATPase component
VRPQRGDRLPKVLLADELSFGLAPLVVERSGVVGQKVNEDAVVAAQAV